MTAYNSIKGQTRRLKITDSLINPLVQVLRHRRWLWADATGARNKTKLSFQTISFYTTYWLYTTLLNLLHMSNKQSARADQTAQLVNVVNIIRIPAWHLQQSIGEQSATRRQEAGLKISERSNDQDGSCRDPRSTELAFTWWCWYDGWLPENAPCFNPTCLSVSLSFHNMSLSPSSLLFPMNCQLNTDKRVKFFKFVIFKFHIYKFEITI